MYTSTLANYGPINGHSHRFLWGCFGLIISFSSSLQMNKIPQGLERYLINPSDYSHAKQIGAGGFASVELVENQTSGEKYAAKSIQHNDETGSDQSYLKEISIMAKFHVPTIIKFYGFSPQDLANRPRPTIFMEYRENGSLKTLLQQEREKKAPPRFDNTAKQIILCGIVHGMMNLHSRRVIHLDLKPGNILLDSDFITVDAANPSFASVDGILYSKDMENLICYPAGRESPHFTIPSSVTSIGDYAFSCCSSLQDSTIPFLVTSIGFRAFEGCHSLNRST